MLLLPSPGARASDCNLEPGPVRAVAKVLDGETVRLDDGAEVRLIGALTPRAQDGDAEAEFWAPEQDARNALERLVAGQSVELAYAGRRADRHGRQLAHLFTAAPGARVWVQGYLVEHGHARAYALPGSTACIAELAVLEARARQARLGLWRHASYQVLAAERSREILRRRDRFLLVEGTVRKVSDVRGQLFLNFGEDWRTDFTAHLTGEQRRQMQSAGTDPRSLEGRRVRVRGWITWRNGPYIDIADWREVEIVAQP